MNYSKRDEDKRRTNGQFRESQIRPDGRMTEEDRLIDRVEFRVTNRDWRRLMVMFQHHRQEFGWVIHSDMFRAMMLSGLSDHEKRTKSPTPDMATMREMHEELEHMARQAKRHTDLDMVLNQVDADIDIAVRAGDLAAVRGMLAEFKERTARIKHDHAIRARREMEFDKRWGRLFDSVNRGASLTRFEGEEED